MRHPMGNGVRNSGLLGDGGCNRFCVVVQACDAADDPIHILGDLLVDHLGSISTNQGRLMRQQSAQQYTTQDARGRARVAHYSRYRQQKGG